LLSTAPFAAEIFSRGRGHPESSSGPSGCGTPPNPHAHDSADRLGPFPKDDAMASATMTRGDQVVFERLDVAEVLGIWRHARGRVVSIHGQGGRPETVDVKFDGHETLRHYLPNLFRRVQ
jgi:hypothetical protein